MNNRIENRESKIKNNKNAEQQIAPEMRFFQNSKKGQAMVEYAIVVFAMIGVFMAIVTPFCAAFDTYLQGLYFVLFNPLP